MKDRIERVRKLLNTNKIDALLISSVPNIIYLCGYPAFSKIYREGYLIVTQNKNYLISSPLHVEDVSKIIKGFEIIDMQKRSYLVKILEDLSKKYKTIGIEENDLRVSEYKRLKKYFHSIKAIDLSDLRTIKENEEILYIKKACEIADKAFSQVIKKVNENLTEEELATELDFIMRRLGGEVAFETVVAFGKNTSVPHHKPENKKLKKNEPILLDFGASFNNYCCDISRTFVFGKANEKFKKMYLTVLEAQKRSITILKNGINASEVDTLARNYITENNYHNFPHALGHGLGIEVHESPTFYPHSKDIVKEYVPFALEPGIYIPNFGGVRIEDTMVLRNNKIELLSRSPKHLIEL